MFYIKVHDSGERKIVAICDKVLLGNTIKTEYLKLEVLEKFYKGEIKDKEEAANILGSADNLNIVGKESIEFCAELGLIDKENVLEINGVPYALAVGL